MHALRQLCDQLIKTLMERGAVTKDSEIDQVPFEECINSMPSMVTVHGFKHQPFYLFLNDQARDFYGFDSNDRSKMNVTFYSKTLHPKSLPLLVHSYQFFFSDRRDFLTLTYQLRNARGHYEKVYGVSKTMTWNKKGQPALVASVTCREADWNRLNAICSFGMDSLGERPRECLGLLLQGHTNAQIADEMNISVKTVEKHVDQILKLSGFSSRVELINACVQID